MEQKEEKNHVETIKEITLSETIIKHSKTILIAKLAIQDCKHLLFRITRLVPPMSLPSLGHIRKMEDELRESIDSLSKLIANQVKAIFRAHDITFGETNFHLSISNLRDAYVQYPTDGTTRYVLFLKDFNNKGLAIKAGDVKEFFKVDHLLKEYSKENRIEMNELTYHLKRNQWMDIQLKKG